MQFEKIRYFFFLSLVGLGCEFTTQDDCEIDFCDATKQVIRTVEEGYGILHQKISGAYFKVRWLPIVHRLIIRYCNMICSAYTGPE